MTTAFVAGATGYTGREVVRQLCGRGCRVLAHVRPGSPSTERWAGRFREWGADEVELPWEPAALTASLAERGPDLVFGLLGTTRARARADGLRDVDRFDVVDFRLTAMLIDAVVASGTAARFVYLSSVGARAASGSKYLAARGRAEAALAASGLAYTIARPSIISGPGRDDERPFERAAAVVGNGLLAVAGLLGARRLRDRLRSIDNAGLARALIEAALDPSLAGQTLAGDALQALAARPPA